MLRLVGLSDGAVDAILHRRLAGKPTMGERANRAPEKYRADEKQFSNASVWV